MKILLMIALLALSLSHPSLADDFHAGTWSGQALVGNPTLCTVTGYVTHILTRGTQVTIANNKGACINAQGLIVTTFLPRVTNFQFNAG